MQRALSAEHYDDVTAAWRLIMGESFHYGLFDPGEVPAEARDRATARLTDALWAAIELPAPRVVDLGCGVGGPARVFAARGARVVGVTNSLAGRDAARAATPPHIAARFVLADALATGLPDGAFDAALVLESSHLMPDLEALFVECARLLRPGGRLAWCDLVWHQPPDLAELFAGKAAFRQLDRAFGRARIATQARVKAAVAGAGFCALRWTDFSAATRPTLDAWRDRLELHRAAIAHLWQSTACADFCGACATLAELWDEGRMGYALLSATRP